MQNSPSLLVLTSGSATLVTPPSETEKEEGLPPVTSHICVMADSSVGTLPSCSLSGVAAPGSLRTRANSRWSHRKGSFVSSLPGRGEFRGRCSWAAGEGESEGKVEW